MIYFDHNSTSPYSESVRQFLRNESEDFWANPSASYRIGQGLSNRIQEAKKFFAEYFGCKAGSIIFTSGATESINTVLSLHNLKKHGIRTVVSSPLEHSSTLDCLRFLKASGIEVRFIGNDSSGRLNLDELESFSSDEKALFTFMHVNNELGTINPVAEISHIAQKKGHLLHVDGVQALGKLRDDICSKVDFASFSGHKIGSLKGVGILYVKEPGVLSPLLFGGGQENGHRSGTSNFTGIMSFELALRDSMKWDLANIEALRNHLESELMKAGVRINCLDARRICNTSSMIITGINNRTLTKELSDNDVFISLGSACTSACPEPSHVLKGIGLDHKDGMSSVRVSLGNTSTLHEVQFFVDKIRSIMRREVSQNEAKL